MMKVLCLCLFALGHASGDFDDASALLQTNVAVEAPWDPLFDAVVSGKDKLPGINDLKADIAMERLKTNIKEVLPTKFHREARKGEAKVKETMDSLNSIATLDDRAKLRALMGHWKLLKQKGRGSESDWEKGLRQSEMFATQAEIGDLREKIRGLDKAFEYQKGFVAANVRATNQFNEQVRRGNPFAQAAQNNFIFGAGAAENNQNMAAANFAGWKEGTEAAMLDKFDVDEGADEFMNVDKFTKVAKDTRNMYRATLEEANRRADIAARAPHVETAQEKNDKIEDKKVAKHQQILNAMQDRLPNEALKGMKETVDMKSLYKEQQDAEFNNRAWAAAKATNGLPQQFHPKVVTGDEIEQKLKQDTLRHAYWSGDGD